MTLARLLCMRLFESCRLLTVVAFALSTSCSEREIRNGVGDSTRAKGPQIEPPREPVPESSRSALVANADKALLTRHEEPPSHPWQRILTLDGLERDAVITSLWVSAQRTLYLAGNRGVMRQALDAGVRTEAIGTNDFMLDVWGTSDVDVYAVGGRGAVVHYDGRRWVVEREPGPAVRRSKELLHSVGFFLTDQTVVAFGPTLSLKRLPTGEWIRLSAAEDQHVRARWSGRGRKASPCLAVGVQSWAADRAGKEWVQCQDRRAYWLEHDAFVPHGLAPSECQFVFRHVFFDGALYVTCDGALFRNVGTNWQREPIPDNVSVLTVTDRCLLAADRNAVFRMCIGNL